MLLTINAINKVFSRELIGHLASRLGESETGVSKAISGIVPLVVQALASKARAGEDQLIFQLSAEAYRALHGQLGSVTGILGLMGRVQAQCEPRAPGEPLLLWLFGTNGTVLSHPISAFSGIRPTSAINLLSMVTAVLPALLGQCAHQQGLKASGLSTALLRLSPRVATSMPPTLRAVSVMLGLMPTAARQGPDGYRLPALLARLKLALGRGGTLVS